MPRLALAVFASCFTLAAPGWAQTKAVMEGVAASRYTIKVDTASARVTIATTSYSGAVPDVGLFVASNTVIGAGDAVVIYATGSVVAGGVILGASGAHKSSTTVNFGGSTSATAFGVCYATQTITTSGGCVAGWYRGALENSSSGGGCLLNVLADGAFISPSTKDKGLSWVVSHSANGPQNASWFAKLDCPAAGTHSYCISLAALANTCSFTNNVFVGNEFGIMEIQ